MTPPRRVAAIVFDMDGTLLDSSDVVPDAYAAVVAASTGAVVTRESVIAAYGVGPPRMLLGHLLGREVHDQDLAAYHEALRRGASSVRAYDGVVDALSELAARRVPLALFTGADRVACTILLEGVGLTSRFRAIVGADEVPRPKPNPDGIREACARLGVDPADAAYVGDAPRDLEAARRSGALAVAASWGHEYDPSEPADLVVRAPGDLVDLFE